MYRLLDLPPELQQTAFEDIDDMLYNAHYRNIMGIPSHFVDTFRSLNSNSVTSFNTKWLRNQDGKDTIVYLPSDKLKYFLDGIRRWVQNTPSESLDRGRFEALEAALLPLLLKKEREISRKAFLKTKTTSATSSLEKDAELKEAKLRHDKERLLIELASKQKARLTRLTILAISGIIISLILGLCGHSA